MAQHASGTLHINDQFVALESRSLDSKKRITLGAVWFEKTARPIKSFQVYQNKDGDILLRPEISVPAREAWVYDNPQVFSKLQQGLRESAAGKGKVVKNLDAFIKKL
ncbi:MAG: hypothetical protein HQL23_02245 [Candidatus Omnitrophica bacterium]|nr:hypothetical protein [Candidatus Omnitrophota bacterium]